MKAFEPTSLLMQFAAKAKAQGLFFCLSHQKLILLPTNSLKDFSKLDKRAKTSFIEQLMNMMAPEHKNIIQALQHVGGDLFHMFEKEAAKMELSGCARAVAYYSKDRNALIINQFSTHEAYNHICCDKKYLHKMVNNTISKHKEILQFIEQHPTLMQQMDAVSNFTFDGKRMKEISENSPLLMSETFNL